MHGHKIVNQNHIHFITPTVVGWLDVFTRKKYRDIVIESLRYCQSKKRLIVYAYVIMSNHLHLILATESGSLSDIIRDFKSHTAKQIIRTILSESGESRKDWMLRLFKYYGSLENNMEYKFWQKDNRPIELISDEWCEQKLTYIHNNPVRAGIVEKAEDYIYSSASNYIYDRGILDVEILKPIAYAKINMKNKTLKIKKPIAS